QPVAPWRDLPQEFGPYTTCYNRFVRWRRARVWSRIMDALAAPHDAAVQMIDTSIVRVHQHAACIARNRRQSMGRSRGGLTSKIHAVVDSNGLPVRLALTTGEAHDNRLAAALLSRLRSGSMLLADRGYDAPDLPNWQSRRTSPAAPRTARKCGGAKAPMIIHETLFLLRARDTYKKSLRKIVPCRVRLSSKCAMSVSR